MALRPLFARHRRMGVAVGLVLLAVGWMAAGRAHADKGEASAAAVLHARYDALQDHLRHNPFQRPLYLESSEVSDGVQGDVFARVDYPFSTAVGVLNGPAQWCDILMLHLNTKYCCALTADSGRVLDVGIGRKDDQPLHQVSRVDFAYRVVADTPHYLHVRLDAAHGPLSTRDYRIVFEAIPLDSGRTFMHLAYAYAYGLAGRLALHTYLGTVGSRKVGFTVVGTQSDGRPRYVGGLRGVVERNSLRYYLAIESFLGALSAPPSAQLEKRLHTWFDAIERYPLQLHDLERNAYLEMKRKESARQQADCAVTPPGVLDH